MDKMKKVLILGASGMLGSMVDDYLSKKKDIDVTAMEDRNSKVDFRGYDYIINCIGIIKQKMRTTEEVIRVNSLLPYQILRLKKPETKVIQIATDCVFSGDKGKYIETDIHDAGDAYAKTKSLGEIEEFYNIRTSIIGPHKKSKVSLLEWFLSQKKGATIKGYTNHYWNGITTLHFAKLCYAIIKNNYELPSDLHIVPADIVSKYRLLKIIAKEYKREDIQITKHKDIKIDRSLSSLRTSWNKKLWKAMDYDSSPTIDQMVKELAKYGN